MVNYENGLGAMFERIKTNCCRRFAVLEDLFIWYSLCLSMFNFIHHLRVEIGLASFHVYITSINRMINRMIRWKRKKAKYPDEKFAKGWKPLGKKLLTLAWIVSGSSVSISQFFSSCQLLAQNWILKEHRAPMQKYSSGNLGDALLSTTDLILL